MRRMLHTRWHMLAFFLTLALAAEGHAEVSLTQITRSLVCLCNCGMTVDACGGAMQCTVAKGLTAEAKDLIAQGKSRGEILAAFVAKHGEKVLAAPTKKGFNLTAWLLPFLAIGGVGFGVTAAIKRWALSEKKRPRTKGSARGRPGDEPYEARLDAVLRKLD